MAQEPDMAAGPRQTGMLLEHDRIAHRVQVGVDNRGSVQHYDYRSAFGGNFLSVPFTGRLLEALPGGDHVVNGSMILRWPQFALIASGAIVQYLDLHPLVGSVS